MKRGSLWDEQTERNECTTCMHALYKKNTSRRYERRVQTCNITNITRVMTLPAYNVQNKEETELHRDRLTLTTNSLTQNVIKVGTRINFFGLLSFAMYRKCSILLRSVTPLILPSLMSKERVNMQIGFWALLFTHCIQFPFIRVWASGYHCRISRAGSLATRMENFCWNCLWDQSLPYTKLIFNCRSHTHIPPKQWSSNRASSRSAPSIGMFLFCLKVAVPTK